MRCHVDTNTFPSPIHYSLALSAIGCCLATRRRLSARSTPIASQQQDRKEWLERQTTSIPFKTCCWCCRQPTNWFLKDLYSITNWFLTAAGKEAFRNSRLIVGLRSLDRQQSTRGFPASSLSFGLFRIGLGMG